MGWTVLGMADWTGGVGQGKTVHDRADEKAFTIEERAGTQDVQLKKEKKTKGKKGTTKDAALLLKMRRAFYLFASSVVWFCACVCVHQHVIYACIPVGEWQHLCTAQINQCLMSSSPANQGLISSVKWLVCAPQG